jgi:5-(carboxyamino)imidazole ribonucleotide synthase
MQPILPPATIGMLGGGQLGRYALVAARLMGYRTVVLDPDPSAPAGAVADEHIVAAYDDPAALEQLIATCDVVTTEFENPPADALDFLAASIPVSPPPAAVRIAQDRVAEKHFLASSGFPVGDHAVLDPAIGGVEQVPAELADRGVVIKTARLGYDGKGQRRVTGLVELGSAWAELGMVCCVVEALLELRTEVSVIVARTADGTTSAWPVAENTHSDGILDVSIVPTPIDPSLATQATVLAIAIADRLDYVGVLAVELFVVGSDSVTDASPAQLVVNELAPRPHNSGHWTIDGSVTSQYEQQIRAICGVGLGSTEMTSPGVAMVNLLGDLWPDIGRPDWSTILAEPDAKLHLYGKAHARPGRKMGHLTVLDASAAEAARRAVALRAQL